MQFFERGAFQLFWTVPLLLSLLFVTVRAKRKLSFEFALEHTLNRISTDTSLGKGRLRWLLIMGTVVFLVIALARPQWGEEIHVVKRHGVDIVFVLDTSLSMLTEDVKPNRLSIAKREIKNFVEKLKGDRIGMVAFAGSAFLQVPLTIDYAAFRLFLEAVDVGYIPRAGSSLRVGLTSAIQAFKEGKDEQRVIVVLSDGESHTAEGDDLIQQISELGVRVYAVGVGTGKGGPIPLRSEGKQLSGYKKDAVTGELIISSVQEEFLKKLTKETGGLYYPVTASGKEISLIYEDIQKIGKKELSEEEKVRKEDRFQLFLAVALILLCIETILGERKGLVSV